jgi:hypothetical protein
VINTATLEDNPAFGKAAVPVTLRQVTADQFLKAPAESPPPDQ